MTIIRTATPRLMPIKEKIDITKYDIILEPSAGNGVFWNLFEKTGSNDFNKNSSPGVIEKYTMPNSNDAKINQASVIPNPLDSDIDIPLM